MVDEHGSRDRHRVFATGVAAGCVLGFVLGSAVVLAGVRVGQGTRVAVSGAAVDASPPCQAAVAQAAEEQRAFEQFAADAMRSASAAQTEPADDPEAERAALDLLTARARTIAANPDCFSPMEVLVAEHQLTSFADR